MLTNLTAAAMEIAQALPSVSTGDEGMKEIILYSAIGIAAVAIVVFLTFKDKFIKPKDYQEDGADDSSRQKEKTDKSGGDQ